VELGEKALKDAQQDLPIRFSLLPELLRPLPVLLLPYLLALGGFYYVQFVQAIVFKILAERRAFLLQETIDAGLFRSGDSSFISPVWSNFDLTKII
jgi:hypothetical protein